MKFDERAVFSSEAWKMVTEVGKNVICVFDVAKLQKVWKRARQVIFSKQEIYIRQVSMRDVRVRAGE